MPPHNTSRTCPACGHIAKENRRKQALFLCVDCGYENNADVVGAINILARGHRVLACGESVQLGRSVKQEPAEGSRNASHEPVGIPFLSCAERSRSKGGEDVNVSNELILLEALHASQRAQ